MERPATITDIAKTLKISPSTVSRALNGHPSISEATKVEVMKLALELNYQPNLAARNLLNQKSGIIGVIVPEITSYFFSTVITAIQDSLSSVGYKILISQTNECFDREVKVVNEMSQLRVEGLLVSPSFKTRSYSHLEEVRKAGTPIVIFDRDCPEFNSSKVFVDVYDGAFQAVSYLVKCGRKKIAHIAGPTQIPTFKDRFDAYCEVLSMHLFSVDDGLIIESGGFGPEDGIEAVQTLLKNGTDFDAIFCVNDAVAIGAMHALREKGFRIPEDVDIVGFDDEPYSAVFYPSITTVWQPVYDMGLLSSKLLLDDIGNKHNPPKFRYEVLKPELIIRNSTRDS